MPRTALFVIDIQRGLASDPSTQIPQAVRIVSAGREILHHARANISHSITQGSQPHLDIVVVQHSEPPEKGNLQRGSAEWELVFAPRNTDWTSNTGNECLVSKDVRDTFESNPTLAVELREREVGTIVAFGIQSECCVLSTCRGALAAGFKVVLLRGAHSTYDTSSAIASEIEKEVEDVLAKEGARILSYEEWVNHLARSC